MHGHLNVQKGKGSYLSEGVEKGGSITTLV